VETVLFDTHAYIKKLESSGVSPVQAEAHAEALLEAFRGGLATKADVKESENALRADMQKMEAGIRADMQKMETGIRADMQKMETGIRDDMRKMETGIRTDMQKMESTLKGEFNSLLRWIIALVIGLFAAQSALFLKMVH
jgi:hypothetical protein